MRAKSEKKWPSKETCMLCKQHKCIDDRAPKVLFRINPAYRGRVTRSITNILKNISDFILIEVYKSMPLLGDEEQVPNWEVHVARFALIFTKNGWTNQ